MTIPLRVASTQLARRLEALELHISETCLDLLRVARPQSATVAENLAGGRALFFGTNSPLSQCLSAGMNGLVVTEDLDRLEMFFQARGAPVVISLCPLADPSLLAHLRGRGYRITHFEHTLVRSIEDGELANERLVVRGVKPGEADDWARSILKGFAEGGYVDEDMVDLFHVFESAPGASAYLVELEGQIAGGGAMSVHERAAMCYGDATLPEFRNLGVQSALIARRLRDAVSAGCELAVACVNPAGASHRNYERAGFQVAYTKTMLVKDWT